MSGPLGCSRWTGEPRREEGEEEKEAHLLVDRASVDVEPRVRLGDLLQAWLGAEDAQELDLRHVEAPVELRKGTERESAIRRPWSVAPDKQGCPMDADVDGGRRTRIEMAAMAVPPVAMSGSRRKSVSTVTVLGNFWYCASRPSRQCSDSEEKAGE